MAFPAFVSVTNSGEATNRTAFDVSMPATTSGDRLVCTIVHGSSTDTGGAAPTNWVSKIGTTDIRPFNEWGLGEVNREPDRAWERSPIRYAGRITTPTLLVHGEADQRVPVTQATELYLALRAAGVDTDMVSYPRQGHAFHERAFQLDLLRRLVGWFDRYLQPEAARGDDAAR